ncbi:heavy metal-binding domain-containing protein, partial [Bacillus sp. D-CC]
MRIISLAYTVVRSKLKEARDIAMDEMKELAKQKGANA